jgi:hypothetical protein
MCPVRMCEARELPSRGHATLDRSLIKELDNGSGPNGQKRLFREMAGLGCPIDDGIVSAEKMPTLILSLNVHYTTSRKLGTRARTVQRG